MYSLDQVLINQLPNLDYWQFECKMLRNKKVCFNRHEKYIIYFLIYSAFTIIFLFLCIKHIYVIQPIHFPPGQFRKCSKPHPLLHICFPSIRNPSNGLFSLWIPAWKCYKPQSFQKPAFHRVPDWSNLTAVFIPHYHQIIPAIIVHRLLK